MSCHTPVLEPLEQTPPAPVGTKSRLRTVALIGPPNSGKSTLFNRLTGMRQKVANYPGVTVEHHSGRMKSIGRNDLTLIDLPGIYSLATYSEDARVAVEVLTGKMPGVPKPDCVLLVLDSTHLNRQLMLAAPVFSIGLPTLVLLNMSDQMAARGGRLDALALARELGHPVAIISASKGEGIDVIPAFLQNADDVISSKLRPVQLPVLQSPAACRTWATQVTARTNYRSPQASLWTQRLDSLLLHRFAGPLIFLAVVFAVFQVVFTLGQPLSDGLGTLLTHAGAKAALLLPRQLATPASPRRPMERRPIRPRLSPADPAAVPLHRRARRLRLPGPRSSHRRPCHALYRPQRQGLHPTALGLRLRRTGHHGDAHHRKQA